MSLPKMETDVRNIENLPKRPNATNGLNYKALQQVFDKAGVDIQSFLNNTLIPALDSGIGGVDINALQEAQGADKEMAFPVYDPRVGVNAKLFIADILPFAVTVTKAASGAMTCDKTFALVRAAYNAGRTVFCMRWHMILRCAMLRQSLRTSWQTATISARRLCRRASKRCSIFSTGSRRRWSSSRIAVKKSLKQSGANFGTGVTDRQEKRLRHFL